MKDTLTAREIMNTRLITLRPEQDVHDAIDLLLHNRVAGAPVVNSEGDLVGFLSEKDCMQALLDAIYDSNPSTTVEMCMTKEVFTVTEDTNVLTIANIFLHRPYRRLPVVRGRKLVGQISRRDFLIALAKWSRENASVEYRANFLYLSNVADRSVLPIT
jgi:CBS domain-containing protein